MVKNTLVIMKTGQREFLSALRISFLVQGMVLAQKRTGLSAK